MVSSTRKLEGGLKQSRRTSLKEERYAHATKKVLLWCSDLQISRDMERSIAMENLYRNPKREYLL